MPRISVSCGMPIQSGCGYLVTQAPRVHTRGRLASVQRVLLRLTEQVRTGTNPTQSQTSPASTSRIPFQLPLRPLACSIVSFSSGASPRLRAIPISIDI
jgi:hypothetical protein